MALGPGIIASCSDLADANGSSILTRDGSLGNGAEVRIDANCTPLTVSTQGGSGWSFAGSGSPEASTHRRIG